MKAYRWIGTNYTVERSITRGLAEFVSEYFIIYYDGSFIAEYSDMTSVEWDDDLWEECELELTPEQKIQLVKLRMS